MPLYGLGPPLPGSTGFLQMRAVKSTFIGYYEAAGWLYPAPLYPILRDLRRWNDSEQAQGKGSLSYARRAYGVKNKMARSAWKSRMDNGPSAVCSSRTGVLCPRRWSFDHSHCQGCCSLLMCVVSSHCVRPPRNRGPLTPQSQHPRAFLDLPPSRGW
jgi:hypothetical protein